MKSTDREAFKAAHDLGLTRDELAERFDITPGSATRIMRELGLTHQARGAVDREELAQLVKQGWSVSQLAEHYQVNVRTISRIKADLGITQDVDRRRISQEKLDQIRAMIEDGVPHNEIIRTLHVDRDTIHRHFPGTAWTQQQHSEFMATVQHFKHFNKARPRTYNHAKYQKAA